MAISEAQKRASKKYVRKAREEGRVRNYTLTFYYATDSEIIEKLASLDNRTDYIRQLIYEDIRRSKKSSQPTCLVEKK